MTKNRSTSKIVLSKSEREKIALNKRLASLPSAPALPAPAPAQVLGAPEAKNILASTKSEIKDNSPKIASLDAYALALYVSGEVSWRRYPYMSSHSTHSAFDVINHVKNCVDRLAILQVGALVSSPSEIKISLFPRGIKGISPALANASATRNLDNTAWIVTGKSESGVEFKTSVKFPSGKTTTARNMFDLVVRDTLPRLSVNFGSGIKTINKIDSYVEFSRALGTLSTLRGKLGKCEADKNIAKFNIDALGKEALPEQALKAQVFFDKCSLAYLKAQELVRAQEVTLKTLHSQMTVERREAFPLLAFGIDDSKPLPSGTPTPKSSPPKK